MGLNNQPLVSVIVTTKNSSSFLKKLLETIREQSYKGQEIVLVDNNSQDNTVEIARKFTTKIYNLGPERSAQRNFGVKKAQGKYLLILDSDMELESTVIKECVNLLENQKDFSGVIIPEKSFGKGYWAKCKSFEREFYIGDETIEAPRFFRRKSFEEFEGYDI